MRGTLSTLSNDKYNSNDFTPFQENFYVQVFKMSCTVFTNNNLKAWHIRLSFKQQQGKSHCLRTSQVTNTAQNRKRIPKTTSWVDCCQKSKFLQYRFGSLW